MLTQVLDFTGLEVLIKKLRDAGYRTVGPTVESGAVVYNDINSARDLPRGFQDKQGPGEYRLSQSDSAHLFDWVIGPQSLKTLFHKSLLTLWEVSQTAGQLRFTPGVPPSEKIAVIGARPCEIAAMLVQDRVFSGGDFHDPRYQAYRDQAFIVAVNCTRPGGNCFCTSMKTGPGAERGYDICLTEIESDGQVIYFARSDSAQGKELLDAIPHRAADQSELDLAERLVDEASREMGHQLDADGVRGVLRESHDNRHWQEIATKCLACGNCTLVCPTCFCAAVEDSSDLLHHRAARVRRWESCFTRKFTYLHGGYVRQSGASRYRHWLTHKLSSWHDQFGTSGCVGCGRCITWCPVGINIVDEATAVAKSHRSAKQVVEEMKK